MNVAFKDESFKRQRRSGKDARCTEEPEEECQVKNLAVVGKAQGFVLVSLNLNVEEKFRASLRREW